MAEEDLVSVVIPVHNGAATIGQALDSVALQDVPTEILVVDDHSDDGLEEVLAQHAAIPRLRLLHSTGRPGAAAARNLGVAGAQGTYTAFLDCDDWWGPGKLAAQLTVMRQTGVVLCCTGRELMNADGSSTGRVIPVKGRITYRSLLAQNCINCSSVLMRTETAREFPMEHDELHEDYILWLKILRRYGEAAGIPEPYLKYRMDPHSKSGGHLHSAKMTYQVYRYMGYGTFRSVCFFLSYAAHGVWKYRYRAPKI